MLSNTTLRWLMLIVGVSSTTVSSGLDASSQNATPSINCSGLECDHSTAIYSLPNTFDQELGSEIPVRVVGVGDSITAALVVRQGQILSTSTSTATVVVPLVTSTVLIDGVSNPTITIAQVSMAGISYCGESPCACSIVNGWVSLLSSGEERSCSTDIHLPAGQNVIIPIATNISPMLSSTPSSFNTEESSTHTSLAAVSDLIITPVCSPTLKSASVSLLSIHPPPKITTTNDISASIVTEPSISVSTISTFLSSNGTVGHESTTSHPVSGLTTMTSSVETFLGTSLATNATAMTTWPVWTPNNQAIECTMTRTLLFCVLAVGAINLSFAAFL